MRTSGVFYGSSLRRASVTFFAATIVAGVAGVAHAGTHSVARQWNEILLESIRKDFARPTVHARNLYHTSVAMWDAWATFDTVAKPVLFTEKHPTTDGTEDAKRNQAISHAMYTVLKARFSQSPGYGVMLPQYDALMIQLGYNPNFSGVVGNTPAAIGNRVAQTVLAFGLSDNSNEQNNYANKVYQPINPPLVVPLPGNPSMIDPNRWQPLALDFFIDQAGQVVVGGYPPALTPEWGQVKPFSLTLNDVSILQRDNIDYDWWVYHDPGPPPLMFTSLEPEYKWGYELVASWSGHLDPSDGVMWDISPTGVGNAVLPNSLAEYHQFYDLVNGGDNGQGHPVNPVTGQPYPAQMVPRGDYARVLAEFWADGPNSETPPGHWFSVLNYVSDHPLFVKKLEGRGPVLGDLEWDVKSYLALGGVMHDVAIACWGAKGYYDYVRPVSAIRWLADRGQCTNPNLPHYDVHGFDLIPGRIELITSQTTMPGQQHEHLFGYEGEIAIYSWRGPTWIVNPATDVAGSGWILAKDWWPYQRPTFVSPPFPGYYSGHSTYSRAGAIIMERLTGSQYFPGGLGEFVAPQNQYLVFEDGPSVNMTLQWASYYDASDQCSLSRIWGGIHPPADDIPGREVGEKIGPNAFAKAKSHWDGTACGIKDAISPFGLGCTGSGGIVPTLGLAGCPTPGGGVSLEIDHAKPQSIAVVLIGFAETNIPLAGSCSLQVAPILSSFALPLGGTVGVAGSGSVTVVGHLPPTTPIGTTLKLQAFVGDDANPWGYSTTNGISVTFK
jgi:hypothetical protein